MCLRLADNTLCLARVATLLVDNPYYTGKVEAWCVGLIICSIPGAHPSHDPNPIWKTVGVVVTRGQAKGNKRVPLCVPKIGPLAIVTKDQLRKLQREDLTLHRLVKVKDGRGRGQWIIWFEEKSGVLYRVISNGNGDQYHVVVPSTLRNSVLEVAHSSI